MKNTQIVLIVYSIIDKKKNFKKLKYWIKSIKEVNKDKYYFWYCCK